MEYDYSKLSGKIIETLGSRKRLANELGISETSLYNKLNNKAPWSHKEMFACSKILSFDKSEIGEYFFTKKVSKYRTLKLS